jgi:hypothetical protein
VKIQEPLRQLLSMNNMDLVRKFCLLPDGQSVGQTENATDSYAFGADLGHIEEEALQALKSIIGDFKNTINSLSKTDQNIMFHDIHIKLPEKSGVPDVEHDILMLFPSGKGESPEKPAKIFLSYKTDTALSGMLISSQFVGKVVEEAKLFVSLLTGGRSTPSVKTNGEDGTSIGTELGFIIKFSSVSYTPGKEPSLAPQLISDPLAQKDASTQVTESIYTYRISSRAVDNGYLSIMSLPDGKESGILEKLLTFIADMPSYQEQIESGEGNRISQEDQIAKQAGNVEHTIESRKMNLDFPSQTVYKENNVMGQFGNIGNATESKRIQIDLPFQEIHLKSNTVVVSLEMQNERGDAAHVIVEPIKKISGLISSQEGELRGTTLYTGFGQGELKSSPMAGFPLLPANNYIIIKNAARFADQVNMLLNADGAVEEVVNDTVPEGTAPSETSLEKLRLFQARSPEVRAVVQNAVKKVFNEFEDQPSAESIGLSLGKNGPLRLDSSILISQLTSNKEETINVLKGLGNTIYERINYLMHPYSGMYVDDKNILSLRATRKDEGALLSERELNKEQSALEKRLNELKLLIERSRLLAKWFTQKENILTDNSEDINCST